jgi:DegV family protein with EDD domain
MRLITNPGSNLAPEWVRRYDVFLTPQKIVVDGVHHDTRDRIEHATVDEWVRTAREHPFVLGTSAAEYVQMFRDIARIDREILAVMTSRRLIGSYTAAVSAERAVRALRGYEDVRIAVVDTKVTDLGSGLAAVMAGEGARVGLPLPAVAKLLETLADQTRFVLVPATLEYLVKGGRASFLKAWIADALGRVPLIALVGGEVCSTGTIAREADVASAIADALTAEVGEGRAVWCGVVHGGVLDRADRLAEAIGRRLDVAYLEVRPLQASIYLHAGPGAVGACVCPIDRLPWRPSRPNGSRI